MPKIMKNGIEYGGGDDSYVWDNLDSSLWQDMTVYNNRLPSGYIAKYAVVNNTAYIYISFYQIDTTKFSSGYDYWTMFRNTENVGLPTPVRDTPLIVSDKHGIFDSACVTTGNPAVSIILTGTPTNYDNTKGINYKTIIQGQYQIQ